VIKPATWTFSAGVYNAFDKRYSIPLSREHRQLSLVQTGRTFLLSVASSL
jgi:outer membrane receptor protein involved in Fe transport